MKRIGIVAHSAEGGALCFLTACREGQRLRGAYCHPEIVVSAIPMSLAMPGWESGDYAAVAEVLRRGVEQVAAAGADFWICPDNTAHIVLEPIAASLAIPGLHIGHVVAAEMHAAGHRIAGLLGTRWTMTGPVYPRVLGRLGLAARIPGEATQEAIHRAIFEELCRGVFHESTTQIFIRAIRDLAASGAECIILGCTEIPLIIDAGNSPLPVLDSTRLLARYAVEAAVSDETPRVADGWLTLGSGGGGLCGGDVIRPEPTASVSGETLWRA